MVKRGDLVTGSVVEHIQFSILISATKQKNKQANKRNMTRHIAHGQYRLFILPFELMGKASKR